MSPLLRLMLREEYRMHVSYSSQRMFLSVPVFIFLISLTMALTLNNLQGTMSFRELLTDLNAGVFLYGLSVGMFGFLGKTYVERRQGKQNFLIALPSLLPLSYRTAFLSMYLRDTIFYLLLMLTPAVLGVLVSVPLSHFSPLSIAFVSISMVLSFLLGISLSFAVSVIGSRSRAALVLMVATFLSLLVGYGALHLYGLESIVPSLGFQLSSPPLATAGTSTLLYLALALVLFLGFTALAVAFVSESYEGKGGSFQVVLPRYLKRFTFSGSYQPYMAKEFVDLVRSGTIGKMSFTYVAPLTFLSFTTWYVNNGLSVPLGFNAVFYAAMVGFFSVMLYSWLTNVDVVDYYETLPVSVPKVIRAKLFVFLFLTVGISTAFVIMISWMNNETRLLWLALPVLYITSVYMVVAVAYLTGLHPNSFLFNPEVLTKFVVVSILPDISLTVLSFSVDKSPLVTTAGIALVLLVLAISTMFFYRGLDRKWAEAGFN